MSSRIRAIVVVAGLVAFSGAALADEDRGERKADAQAVDQACTAEAATAGCSGEVVGKGLLKCIHQYREAHKDFKPSPGCHQALEHLRHDQREHSEHEEHEHHHED